MHSVLVHLLLLARSPCTDSVCWFATQVNGTLAGAEPPGHGRL